MSKSKDLYDLVHSLNASEKRYFKLYIQAFSGQKRKRYEAHFEEILKMKSFNKLIWKRKLQKSSSNKSMIEANTYLYNTILKVLTHFHTESNIHNQLSNQLMQANTLIEKRLYDQALNKLHALKETAENVQLYPFKERALMLEMVMLNHTGRLRGDPSLLNEKEEALYSTIQKHENLAQYTFLIIRYSNLRARMNSLRTKKMFDELSDFLAQPLLQEIKYAQSYSAAHYFFDINIILNFLLGNLAKSYDYALKFFEYFKANFKRKEKGFAFEEITAVFRIMETSLQLKRYEIYLQYRPQFMEALKRIPNNLHYISGLLWLYNSDLLFYIVQGKIKEAQTAIQWFENQLAESNRKTSSYWFIHIKRAYIEFIAGNFNQSIEFVDRVFTDENKSKLHLRSAAKLLYILNHFELGNFIFLENVILSTKRYLIKLDAWFEPEQELILFIQKTINQPTQRINKSDLLVLVDKLKNYKKNPLHQEFYRHIDYLTWAEAKLQNISMEEVLKKA